jgi:hypothetical protein
MIGTITTRFWQAGLAYWHQSSRLQKVLFASGTLLFLAMVVHGVALAATGGSVHGPTSFRKAMTFAETGWLLCWTVGWLLPLITMQRWEQRIVGGSALLFGVGETFLMSTQVWRGVPSHYNLTTTFDAVWFGATGVIAVVFTGAMLVLLRAALRERQLAPSLLLSIRAGTLLIMWGLVIGFVMIMNSSGIWQGVANLLETRFDMQVREDAVGGDLVLLHAIGVHGLNLVPLAAWLLTYSRLDERARTLITALVVANIVVIGVVLSVQVFNAAPLTEIDPVSVTMLLVCGLALLGCYAAAGWWALRAERSAPAPAYRS